MALLALFQLIVLSIVALISYILYIKYKHKNYFGKWGIPYTGTGLFRIFRFLRGKISVPEMEMLMYQESKEAKAESPFAGCTDSFSSPAVVITDLDMARNILVKDFDHFVNRRRFMTQKGDVLFHKMFSFQENEQWKGMRAKLSPIFTTGKIRRLFNIFGESSEKLCNYMKQQMGPGGSSAEGEFDMVEVYSKYAMDVIANCAFAIDSKTFDCGPGKTSKFEEMAQQLQLKFSVPFFLKFLFILAVPKVADFFGLQVTNPIPQHYFLGVIKQVLEHRRETGNKHEDFLQLMMEIQKGLSNEEKNSKEVMEVMTGTTELKAWGEGESTKVTFDDDDMAANSCIFLLAGFETVHSLLLYSAYALALEQEMQEKLLEEIRESRGANGGKLTYEGIHEMKYLDMFVNETLRLYPPALRTERMCSKDYRVPGTNAVIEKGVIIILPIIAIHRDPDHFDLPEKFDPERFLPEKKRERHPYAFTPFGHGPRNCIGMRFALTEVKTLICNLVSNFQVEPCGRTEIPPKFGNSTSLKPPKGMWLRFRSRK